MKTPECTACTGDKLHLGNKDGSLRLRLRFKRGEKRSTARVEERRLFWIHSRSPTQKNFRISQQKVKKWGLHEGDYGW